MYQGHQLLYFLTLMLLYSHSVKLQEVEASLNSPKSLTSYTQLEKFLRISQKESTSHYEKQQLWAITYNFNKTELYPLIMEIILLSEKLTAEFLYVGFTQFCLVFKTQVFRKYLYIGK